MVNKFHIGEQVMITAALGMTEYDDVCEYAKHAVQPHRYDIWSVIDIAMDPWYHTNARCIWAQCGAIKLWFTPEELCLAKRARYGE